MTFEQLKLDLVRWFPSAGPREASEAIWSAQRYLQRSLRIRGQQASQPYTSVADTQKLGDLPSTFLEPLRLYRVDDSSNRVPLRLLTRNEFQDRYPNPTVTGMPTHWTIWLSDDVLLGPTPESAETYALEHLALLADLADGSSTNTNLFTTMLPEALLWAAAERLAWVHARAEVGTWAGKAELEWQRARQWAVADRVAGRRLVMDLPQGRTVL